MTVIRIDATQISLRTRQLSLSAKKTTLPHLLLGHPRSTSTSFFINWVDGHSFREPSYLLLNRRLLPKSKTKFAGNRGQSIFHCPVKVTKV